MSPSSLLGFSLLTYCLFLAGLLTSNVLSPSSLLIVILSGASGRGAELPLSNSGTGKGARRSPAGSTKRAEDPTALHFDMG